MKIGITDCGAKYSIYERWVLSHNLDDIEVIKLGYQLDNLVEIKQCDGVVLTGGEDIHPKYYGKETLLNLCNPDFMDEQRDAFEWKVCEYIFENKIPLLGICRGLQLVNVFLGGTLIPDIPSTGGKNHSKFYEGKDRYHSINILPETVLAQITNCSIGEVNSAHHQSADSIAKPLTISALSEENIVEGLEWNFGNGVLDYARTPLLTSVVSASLSHQSQTMPLPERSQTLPLPERSRGQFLLLIQWHPERLTDLKSAFSEGIRTAFIEGIKDYTENL